MSMNGSRAASMFFVGLAAVAGATVAAAQTTSSAPPDTFSSGDNENVRGRSHPEYDAIGIPAGGFRLYPRLGVAVEWNDNVFASPVDAEEDFSYTLSAGARLASQWGRHELVLSGLVEDTNYVDIDQDLEPVWRIGADGRLDIVRGFEAAGAVGYSVEYEPRGINDTANQIDPTRYDNVNTYARLSREFNRLRLTGRVDYDEVDYDDAVLLTPENQCPDSPFSSPSTLVDNDFRDRDALEFLGRGDYAISPDTALFVAVSHRSSDYKHDEEDADTPCASQRDYERTRGLVGVALDLTNLVRGEAGIGYSSAEYDNPLVETDDYFTWNVAIDWFVTRLTTINLAASRDTLDSGDSRAPARVVTDVGVRVDHELFRNVILWARGGWAEEEYDGPPQETNTPGVFRPFDRVDTVDSLSVGGDWLVNRWAAVQARYIHLERDSEGADDFNSFDQNRATIGVTLRR